MRKNKGPSLHPHCTLTITLTVTLTHHPCTLISGATRLYERKGYVITDTGEDCCDKAVIGDTHGLNAQESWCDGLNAQESWCDL